MHAWAYIHTQAPIPGRPQPGTAGLCDLPTAEPAAAATAAGAGAAAAAAASRAAAAAAAAEVNYFTPAAGLPFL
jgi:hypothetical protein